MKLANLFSILRKRNIGNYKQFIFCLTFAVILIASFSAVMFSPLIQNTLPAGGDSRKQVYMMFVVALAGCLLFSIYATGLFIRYKSREIGVFLALGTEKKKVSRALFGEVCLILGVCSLGGIILGTIVAILIGQGFKIFAQSQIGDFGILSLSGIGVAVGFALITAVCLIVMTFRFTKRTNLMDIINQQRKSEPIKKMATTKYAVVGGVLLLVGMFGGLALPALAARFFEKNLGPVPYLFYLSIIIGLYMLMVYSVAFHKKGRNPKKYYKNVISYGMMKFQGASVVRNMLIISLLIIAGLFACFYAPTNYYAGKVSIASNPVDFALDYPKNADEVTKADIAKLADQYHVTIKDYREGQLIKLLASGYERENYDEKGNLIEQYKRQYCYRQFISEREYNKITGNKVQVSSGKYKSIKVPSVEENIWFRYDDLDYVKNTATGQSMKLQYDGTVNYSGLVKNSGFDVDARLILNDADYERMAKGLPQERKVNQILFNVADLEHSYDFAKALYKEYCLRATDAMKTMDGYDEFQEKEAAAAGEPYGYGEQIKLLPEHSEVDLGWQNAPVFKILNQKNSFLSFSLYYLLFVYVAIICLAAVGVIAYTRSISIGITNKQVFDDLRKLGANNHYLMKLSSSQLKKIYVLPTVLGVLLMLGYNTLMLWQNDGRLTVDEGMALSMDVGICLVIVLYQFILYRVSKKKVEGIVIP